MSRVSGRYDLLDTISIRSGESDDLLTCFNKFKKETGGVIYQHVLVRVNEYNEEFLAHHCPGFELINHTEIVKDKRYSKGCYQRSYNTYKYYDKEYTLKELNKKGVYIEREIKFDNILELAPYFPYLVTAMSSSKDKKYVVISKRSYVDEQAEKSLSYGHEPIDHLYRKELVNIYKQIFFDYYADYKDREVTVEVPITYNETFPHYTVSFPSPCDEEFDVSIEVCGKTYGISQITGQTIYLDNYAWFHGDIEDSIEDGEICKVTYIKAREDR